MSGKVNRFFTKDHRRIIFAPAMTSSRCRGKPINVMLDYFKTILSRVSFDAMLFEKELRKALRSLIEAEIRELRKWCYDRFRGEHEAILNRCFVG